MTAPIGLVPAVSILPKSVMVAPDTLNMRNSIDAEIMAAICVRAWFIDAVPVMEVNATVALEVSVVPAKTHARMTLADAV